MNHATRQTCEEAFRRLDEYLDRELASEEMELVREQLQRVETPSELRSRLFGLLAAERERPNGDAP